MLLRVNINVEGRKKKKKVLENKFFFLSKLRSFVQLEGDFRDFGSWHFILL